MTRIDRISQAADALAKWRRQYPRDKNRTTIYGPTNPVLDKLEALGPNPDPDAVDAAIGRAGGWTDVPSCDECGADGLPAVVQVGEEPDYESSTANVCAACLLKAVGLVRGDVDFGDTARALARAILDGDTGAAVALADWVQEYVGRTT